MSQSSHPEWLMDNPHPAIDESRWQYITQLLCQLFKASAAALVQYQYGEARLMTVRQVKNVGLVVGSVENIDSLKSRLSNLALPSVGVWRHGLIEYPLYWPGGMPFGAVLLVCDVQPPNLDSCQMLAGPMLDLLQSELKVYRQARQIEQMSLQDDTTQMLNSHGFNLMAPRQLNLSRRLGSHAGLVVMENGTQYSEDLAEEKLRALSQVVYDNLREADLAARVDNQIVLLAFVDSEANLDSLVTRLRKQFIRKLEEQRVLTGYSFFTPDSHLELGPMLAEANSSLEQTRARLYPKPQEDPARAAPLSVEISKPEPQDESLTESTEPVLTSSMTSDEAPLTIDATSANDSAAPQDSENPAATPHAAQNIDAAPMAVQAQECAEAPIAAAIDSAQGQADLPAEMQGEALPDSPPNADAPKTKGTRRPRAPKASGSAEAGKTGTNRARASKTSPTGEAPAKRSRAKTAKADTGAEPQPVEPVKPRRKKPQVTD